MSTRHEDGMRSKFREALRDTHCNYPRCDATCHAVGWYLDRDRMRRRPMFGLYSLGCLAEHLLNRAKFGTRAQKSYLRDAMEFYMETRRAMSNVLTNRRKGERVTGATYEGLRTVVDRLVDHAAEASAAVTGASLCECPACRGKRLGRDASMLLAAILREQSRNGTIPRTSELYVEALT